MVAQVACPINVLNPIDLGTGGAQVAEGVVGVEGLAPLLAGLLGGEVVGGEGLFGGTSFIVCVADP
ncbi:hypothetical protein [Rubinisphaera italica]|uniref:hypothetical protein n=1 Tax=Rubinisphaera italica TaxID=2527969 RepID=UPI0011B70FFB|nr:hypothetical protein [Rubinisphaera italica]